MYGNDTFKYVQAAEKLLAADKLLIAEEHIDKEVIHAFATFLVAARLYSDSPWPNTVDLDPDCDNPERNGYQIAKRLFLEWWTKGIVR